MANEKPLRINGTLADVLKVAATYVPPAKEKKAKRKARPSPKKKAAK